MGAVAWEGTTTGATDVRASGCASHVGTASNAWSHWTGAVRSWRPSASVARNANRSDARFLRGDEGDAMLHRRRPERAADER